MLYQRLRHAYPQQIVLSQVALSQLLVTERVPNARTVFNRYSRLVADFVLCTPDFVPLAVFEIDGISHDSPQRADADARKTAVLAAAGIPLVRLNSKQPNDEVFLHGQFAPPSSAAPARQAGVTPMSTGRPRRM